MSHMMRLLTQTMLWFFCLLGGVAFAENQSATPAAEVKIPILVYHRFAPTPADSMTIGTALFESQLKWLKDNQYTVIPLKAWVSYLQGQGPAPAPKSVVITCDDGHKSVYTELWPLIQKYNIPVTLFLYPSAISNASYAITWDQLHELQKSPLIDMQGHTYWHPNFNHDKKKLTPEQYQKFVDIQLKKSKAVLEQKLNIHIDLLAWPFGIYNDYLEQVAKDAGYVAAFSIDGKRSDKSFNMMAQPRFMIVNSQGLKGFEQILAVPKT